MAPVGALTLGALVKKLRQVLKIKSHGHLFGLHLIHNCKAISTDISADVRTNRDAPVKNEVVVVWTLAGFRELLRAEMGLLRLAFIDILIVRFAKYSLDLSRQCILVIIVGLVLLGAVSGDLLRQILAVDRYEGVGGVSCL